MCDAVGSTKMTSDIDVSINTEINFSISIKRLIIILNDLKLIFKDDKFFHHNGKFKLKLVHDFFDINFYITNFELTKNNTKNIGDFDRYFISNCYNNNCKNIINQYYFALLTFISSEQIKIAKLYIYKKRINEYVRTINDLNNISHHNKLNSNNIVDLTSKISLYESGSYHTQGSYFHIVMMLQKKIKFKIKNKEDKKIYKELLSASIIENLCFAYKYKKKINKYILRVKDGFDRLNKYNIKNKIFKRLKINIDKLNNTKDIKNEIYHLIKNIHILHNNTTR